MSLLFINAAHETFTPTQSGAIATIIWECCQVAKTQGIEPYVLSISCDAAPFEWPKSIFIEYPWPPRNRVITKILAAERRLTGWRHLRHRAYATRVAQAIRQSGLENIPFVLFNDPELAVYLRNCFPNAFILHWFQNQHDCTDKFRQQFASSVNIIAAVSDFTGRWVNDFYSPSPQQLHTLYNAVDTQGFHPADVLPIGPPTINFVGRTHPVKAPDLVLRAAQKMATTTTNFQLQIIGSNYWETFILDDYQRELRDMAAELEGRGIPVRFTGHVDRHSLPAEIRKAHIHVTPSRWDEPFGLVTLEGMASGLATVISKTGGTPEIVGDAGFMFERDDVDQLAAHLTVLVEQDSLRREYGAKARSRALDFTWHKTWHRLRKLINV